MSYFPKIEKEFTEGWEEGYKQAKSESADTITRQQAEIESILKREAATTARYDERLNQKDAEIERLREALEAIAENNFVSAGTYKEMYKRWRKVATKAIDIARAALNGEGLE